ncbi:MAG: alpha-amylase, partial [Terracidiphilus sp.]
AYWDLEWELQQRGFDFCYDKKLYDRLEHSNAENIRLHLCADLAYQRKLLRFIENHDEPRAAATFSPAKERAAAITMATLPGIKLFHEGQFEGRKVRPPVFLGRRPSEPVDENLRGFYKKLLDAVNREAFREGQWSLCQRTGWPDNSSFQNLVAWNWVHDDERYLLAVNLSDWPAQAQIQVPWDDAGGGTWHLIDLLSGATFERVGIRSPGLYVELAPWNFHFLQCLPTSNH